MIVVTWNSKDVVEGCLRSIVDEPPNPPWEIIVVDNGSIDGTVDVVRRLAPSTRVIANPTNRGLAAANNQGLVAAEGSRLLICNPDVVFAPGAIDALDAALARHPKAGWVIPRLRYEDGRLQTSAGDLPSLAQAVFGRQVGRRRSAGIPRGFWWDGWPHDEERAVGRGHEAAYLIRRQAVAEIGLQDEHYVLDWEGFDWTDRLRKAGWEVWLAPDANVVHLGGASIRQVPVRWVVSQHRGMYRYFSRRRPPWWRPGLAVVFGLRAMLKLSVLRAGMPLYQWAHQGLGQPGAESEAP
ncbi:MAG: glycosyltransferase family 2 protein [Acidimicrobiales bacterium]